MIDTPPPSVRYALALEAYLQSDTEAALSEAYDIGRVLVGEGSGLLELTRVHAEALEEILPRLATARGLDRVAERVGAFLAEALAPFEMALTGYREATERLGTLAEDLEVRVEARTAELAAAEARYRALVEQGPGLVYTVRLEPDQVIDYVSPQGAGLFEVGLDRAAWIDRIHPEDLARVERGFDLAARGEAPFHGTYRFRHADGRWVWLADDARLATHTSDGVPRLLGVALDVTEHRELEVKLQQSQKLESIGRLAGGIAHDFNNLLTVMVSYVDLAALELDEGHPAFEDLQEIHAAADRAASLTRQLLAVSSRQARSPSVIDIGAVIVEMRNMLDRLVGEHIEVVAELAEAPWPVLADHSQIEQLLLNLVVNARDAMPHGGRIEIATGNRVLGVDDRDRPLDLEPGEYAVLSVSDTGSGMPPDVVERIFEPFFTTKGPGRGTGLGLATCYGVVRQSGGAIRVESRLGTGTRFEVFLPRTRHREEGMAPSFHTPVRGGGERLLLIEDDEALRRASVRSLEHAGFQVAVAGSVAEARAALLTKPVDLVITDVVLPGMGVPDLLEQVAAQQPSPRLLVMSGYGDAELESYGLSATELPLLRKPFGPSELVRAVRKALDAPRHAGAGEPGFEPG